MRAPKLMAWLSKSSEYTDMSSASAAMLRISLTLAFVSTVVAFDTSEFKEADDRGRRAVL